jgi:hypothetical protein
MSDVLWAQAAMGRDARDFFSSDLGRYLVGRCEQEKADAQEKLSRVSPWRRNRIVQLQNEVWRADAVVSWLAELVTSGQQAEQVLEELNGD